MHLRVQMVDTNIKIILACLVSEHRLLKYTYLLHQLALYWHSTSDVQHPKFSEKKCELLHYQQGNNKIIIFINAGFRDIRISKEMNHQT